MKPKKSSTKSGKGLAIPIPRLAPSNVSISPETLEHMKQCEAREWIQRYKKKAIELGSASAHSWWTGIKLDIEKKRGIEAMQDLINRMNKERAHGKSRTE